MHKPAAPNYRAIENALKLNRAFANRRAELAAVSDAQLVAARILYARVERELHRQQPRDGRGKFLSKAWLQRAETFTPADRAFFRSPITEGK